MATIKLPIFGGMMPSLDKHLISDTTAALSENAWLYSGKLDGMPESIPLHVLNDPEAGVAFRLPGNMGDPTYMYDSTWVEFQHPDTSFISAPVSGDAFKRFYWASPTTVPMYNTLARIQNGDPPYILGLPTGPDISVATAGGSAGLVTRTYLATLVSAYGEEGPAGLPRVVNANSDATYTITVGGVDPNDMGVNRNVASINVYRTIVSAAGTVAYYLVKSVPASTSTQNFEDDLSDAELSSRPILESSMWTGPPNLVGFIVMPNGIVAGWVDNELWFSEAYRPHAWPAAYSLTLDHNIVGLGIINQTLVVCTQGEPYTASGVNPGTITTSKLSSFEPCLSQGSIVSTEDGVYFTSPNGLIRVNPGIAENVTRQAISLDKWRELANQAKVRAARVGSAYFAFGSGTPRAFQENPKAFQDDFIQKQNTEGANAGFIIDPINQNAGVSLLTSDSIITSVFNDVWSGETLTIRGGKVMWLNQEPGFKMRPYRWRSKTFQLPVAKNFSALKCYFVEPEGFVPNPSPVHSNDFYEYDPDEQVLIVRVYADGRHVATREITKSGELHRLPTGFIAEFWEVEFEGRVRVNNLQMSTSVKELSIA